MNKSTITPVRFAFMFLLMAVLLVLNVAIARADDKSDDKINKALIILTSPSLQTQGMAMVLGNTMQAQGVRVDVLLCDKAGDLALSATQSPALEPKRVTPEQLLTKLMSGGASVNVCALYLPNSSHDQTALRDGVGVATPPAMAKMMVDEDTRVFSF
ncbi:hypothetical protein [Thalassospira sp.]|uniref:hypothetical protein n=1 Tax=Thalassospira sp. TaxID=1912094 RepID=UPI000C686E2D|nr:hypothetical protein [Thalassospira sp.]MBC06757.1 hypothetical protein [Thalassospira sp.]|tara:strand:- start:1257 stop:1727 length:471 start_codon:yes stop_codon:yes gene_type:complete